MFTGNMIFKSKLEWSGKARFNWRRIIGKGDRLCKGPEAQSCLNYLRNIRDASKTRVEWEKVREIRHHKDSNFCSEWDVEVYRVLSRIVMWSSLGSTGSVNSAA